MNFTHWPYIRDYTFKEYLHESDEYFGNKTQEILPHAFTSQLDLIEYIQKAPVISYTDFFHHNLQNSDINNLINILKTQGSAKAFNFTKEKSCIYNKDWKLIEIAMRDKKKIPPPIIIQDVLKNSYLLSGNTRLMVFLSHFIILPVKILYYENKMRNI